jgi:hypothetical protein
MSALLPRLAATLTILGVSGCFSSIQPNTEFPRKLDACQNLIECQVLQQQAQRDVAACNKTTTIYMLAPGPTHLSCEDAGKNLDAAESKVAKLRAVEADRQQARLEAERAAADAEREQMKRQAQLQIDAQKREQLARELATAQGTVSGCEASKDARALRKRHVEILNQDPGALVQKSCVPQRQAITVQAQCTDTNGFVRTCAKQVPGETVSYLCPKSVDPDVAKAGLYRLGLTEGYPFPEDLAIHVRDADCDGAAVRLQTIQDQLKALGMESGYGRIE